MEKMKLHSPDLSQDNITKIRDLFPGCVTEAADESGKLRLAVDFDQLRQELSDHIVEGGQERYNLDWPGKREALLGANAQISKTLRPIRDESVQFDATRNIFIEGDNLDFLKIIQENYIGEVKLIYIDPPYNTGNDFVYKDDFTQSTDQFMEGSRQKDEIGNRLVSNTETSGRFDSNWLSMMYPRLRLAHRLLSDLGIIMMSIDDNEVHNLRRMCDEVFGRRNFVCTLIWNKQHSQQQGLFKKYHEYVVVYAKNVQKQENITGGEGIIEAGALKKISKANPASEFTFPADVRFDAPDGTTLTGTFGDSEKVSVIRGQLVAQDGKTLEGVTPWIQV